MKKIQMIDIGKKSVTEREAIARVEILFPEEIFEKVQKLEVPKGDFLCCAKVAGILSAKKTSELIPLCHPIPITHVDLEFKFIPEKRVLEITSFVKTSAQTGVEMEALTSAAISALTVYDMCKSLHKGIKITNLRLLYKKGGKSGEVILEELNQK